MRAHAVIPTSLISSINSGLYCCFHFFVLSFRSVAYMANISLVFVFFKVFGVLMLNSVTDRNFLLLKTFKKN